MLKVYVKRGVKVEEGSISAIKSKGVVWIDALNPTAEELDKLKNETNIPLNLLKIYTDESVRAHVIKYEKFANIIFAAPYEGIAKKTTPIIIFTFGNNNILTLRTKDVDSIASFKKRIKEEGTISFDSPSTFLHTFLDEIVSNYFKVFDDIEEKIEDVEHIVLKKPTKSNLEKIFEVKKSLIFLHKALSANREAITSIEKGFVKKLSLADSRYFRDLYQDIVQLIDIEETYRDILTGVIDIHLSSISNNINDVMRKLTVYGSFVLVPTLISSIYGMNFHFMPEIPWKYGYTFALSIMVISITLLYIYFKNKEWI